VEGDDGLVFAVRFDGEGGAADVSWENLDGPAEAFTWVHLDLTEERARRWLEERSGLDPIVLEALCADETRPRCVPLGAGLLLILRGVNLNPGADPEDMVSLRVYVESARAITVRRRTVMAAQDVRAALRTGRGPRGAGELVVDVARALVARMGGVVSDLEEQTAEIEERVVEDQGEALRSRIADVRRQTVSLRRYLAPQREALAGIAAERVAWLDDRLRLRAREVADHVIRYVEDLDAVREKLLVTQEELRTHLSDQMNRRMFAPSVVAGIFLPLGLITGLLGINVGGIPGADWEDAFALVCGLLGLLAVGVVVLYRRVGWM
jgi:zinc transporter